MALSDREILKQIREGNIIISPFNPEQLATSSYDVTLGSYFFREQRQPFDVYNIWSKEETQKVWGNVHQAERAEDVLPKTFKFGDGITGDDLVILIHPGETILAHTQEFIGGRNIITTMMKARSSLGRSFIEICKCAGWGDVGFFNRWTMEITNNSRYYSIPLVVGRRIAQIVFFNTGPILERSYSEQGKYQNDDNLETLKGRWNPFMMIPQLHRDREISK